MFRGGFLTLNLIYTDPIRAFFNYGIIILQLGKKKIYV